MADAKMEVLIELKDKLTAQLDKVKDSMGDVEKKFETASNASNKFAIGLLAVGTAVGGFAVSALKAASSAEQTKVAFQTMLGSAEKADAFIRKLNDFAKTTPFELKNLEVASKQLLAYGSSADDVFVQLRALGNITAGVGTDKLPQLILAFGQVQAATKLTGSELRQFSEAGVPLLGTLAAQFHTTAANIQEMVSDGKIGFADVQKAIIGMSGEGGKFNDLMTKQSKTLGGMVSNLSDSWDLFLRGQGSKLLDWGKDLVGMLDGLIKNQLPKFIDKVGELIGFFERNKSVLAAVAGIIVGALVPAVLSAAVAFGSLLFTLAPFMIAGGAIFALIEGIREGSALIIGIATAILTVFIPSLISLATTLFSTMIPAVVAFAVAFWPFLAAGAVIAGVIAGIYFLWKNWDQIVGWLTEKWAEFSDWIGSNVQAVADFFVGMWNNIKAGFNMFIDFVANVFKIAIAFYFGLIIGFFELFGVDIFQVFTDLYNLLVSVFTTISEWLSTKLEEMKLIFSTKLEAISGGINKVLAVIKNFFITVFNDIKTTVTGVLTAMSDWVMGWAKPFIAIFDSVWAGVANGAKLAMDTVVSFVKAGFNMLIEMVNDVIRKINSVLTKGGGAIGLSVALIPEIPKLAKGGIVTGPTLAMVGEAGPEAVIPLNKSGGGFGGNVTVNINGGNYLSEDAAMLMADSVVQQLKLSNAVV